MSAGWEGYRGGVGGSTIARHEWKGLLKRKGGQLQPGGLEDHVERREAERIGHGFRMPGLLTGSDDDDDDPDDLDYLPGGDD